MSYNITGTERPIGPTGSNAGRATLNSQPYTRAPVISHVSEDSTNVSGRNSDTQRQSIVPYGRRSPSPPRSLSPVDQRPRTASPVSSPASQAELHYTDTQHNIQPIQIVVDGNRSPAQSDRHAPIVIIQSPSPHTAPIVISPSSRRHYSHHDSLDTRQIIVLPASHQSDPSSWDVEIFSLMFKITAEGKEDKCKQRGEFRDRCPGDYLHDLLAASFVPLTEPYQTPEHVLDLALDFLSVFDENALWDIDVSNLPYQVGQAIYGLTVNARNPSIVTRFVRFRFPFVRFEWHVQTPYYKLRDLREGDTTQIEILWRAWARGGAASGLVAYGVARDTLKISANGHVVIRRREFIVTQVFQAELMTPVPYPDKVPRFVRQDDFLIFSTSQTFIQFMRSSQRRLAFLVALSAMFASLQPIVSKYTSVGGWVFAGVGVLAALISVLTVFVAWILTRVEAHAAKERQ